MSFDGIADRNRNLSREGFNSADLTNAAVADSDSEEVARSKIAHYRNPAPGALSTFDSGPDFGSGGGGDGVVYDTDLDKAGKVIKAILWAIGLLFLAGVLGAVWSAKEDLFEYWRETRRADMADQRIQAYSNFSSLSDWPKEIQAMYGKQKDKPLEKIMDDNPGDFNKLSPGKRHMLGAQIWFKISSKGAGAGEYLMAVQKAPHRVHNPALRAANLSLHFLKRECQKGVELACLDAAKSFAGLVWHGKGSVQEDWVIKSALDQLPASGPLATADAIESLRAKLLATRESLTK